MSGVKEYLLTRTEAMLVRLAAERRQKAEQAATAAFDAAVAPIRASLKVPAGIPLTFDLKGDGDDWARWPEGA